MKDWCDMTPGEFALFVRAKSEAELDMYDHIYQCAQIANGYVKRIKSLKKKVYSDPKRLSNFFDTIIAEEKDLQKLKTNAVTN